MSGSRWLLLAASCLLSLSTPSLWAAERGKETDEELLRRYKVGTDDASLLAFLRQRAEAEKDLKDLDTLVRRLGHDEFEEREKASAKLVALDRAALSALRRALTGGDREVVRRAKECIAVIERRTGAPLPLAVVRKLFQRRPEGMIAALVQYLPCADGEELVEAVYFGLDGMLQRGASLDPALVPALRDPSPRRRALAACLVGRWGSERQRQAARGCLKDTDAEVRLRAAQGLLGAGDKSVLSTLVALLQAPQWAIAWQAEDLLHYAAGEDTPKPVIGRGTPRERKLCQAAWEAWLRDKASRVDLEAVEKTPRRPGLVLVFDGKLRKELPAGVPWAEREPYWQEHIWLCGCEGQPRCKPYTYPDFAAAHLPQRSHRLMVLCGFEGYDQACEVGLLRVGEYIPYKVGIRKDYPRPEQFAQLENGNHLQILGQEEPFGVCRVVEIDARGRTVWEAGYPDPVCALVVCPLIRVGFGRPAGAEMNLDTPAWRLRELKHPVALLRRLAAERLHTYPKDRAIYQAMVTALDDPERWVMGYALRILQDAPVEYGCQAIPSLVRLLTDREVRIQGKATRLLGRCGTRAMPALLAAFQDRAGPDVSLRRGKASIALAYMVELADLRVHQALRAALRDKDPVVRREAAWGLCAQGRKARLYAAELGRLLSDPDPKVAQLVVWKLMNLGEAGENAVPQLLQALKKPALRDDAIITLAEVGHKDPAVLGVLLDQLKPGQEVQTCSAVACAVRAYAKSEKAAIIVPVLKRLLKDERVGREGEKQVQSAAIDSLAKFGKAAKSAVPALLAIVKRDPHDRMVSQRVVDALEKIDPKAADEVRVLITPRRRPADGKPQGK